MATSSTEPLVRPRFKDVPEHWRHPLGPYRQAPKEHGGEWWLVNPFTGREPWLFEDRIRQVPSLPEGFLEIFGPRPTMALFQRTPNASFAYRSAVIAWEQDLRYFKRTGLPEWATPEEVAEAERVFLAWDIGRPRYYEGRYSWMARFVESQIKDYDVAVWAALHWTHGTIAHYQIALASQGILPAKQHPLVPPHIWTPTLELGKEVT